MLTAALPPGGSTPGRGVASGRRMRSSPACTDARAASVKVSGQASTSQSGWPSMASAAPSRAAPPEYRGREIETTSHPWNRTIAPAASAAHRDRVPAASATAASARNSEVRTVQPERSDASSDEVGSSRSGAHIQFRPAAHVSGAAGTRKSIARSAALDNGDSVNWPNDALAGRTAVTARTMRRGRIDITFAFLPCARAWLQPSFPQSCEERPSVLCRHRARPRKAPSRYFDARLALRPGFGKPLTQRTAPDSAVRPRVLQPHRCAGFRLE